MKRRDLTLPSFRNTSYKD